MHGLIPAHISSWMNDDLACSFVPKPESVCADLAAKLLRSGVKAMVALHYLCTVAKGDTVLLIDM
jgi:hypothetical protein